MKKLLLSVLFILSSYGAQAQWGIKGGLNFASLKGDGDGNFNVLTNFHVGAVYEISIIDHFSIQPELLYSVQGAKLKRNLTDDIKLGYFSVPVVAKIYLTDGFDIQIGPQFGMLINESDSFSAYNSKTFDFGFTGGLEFFVTDGLFIQGRYYGGTNKISGNTDIKNTTVQVSLGYMF